MSQPLVHTLLVLIFTIGIGPSSFSQTSTEKEHIIEHLGEDEYQRLMELSLDDFDQSGEGFRMYSDDYHVVSLLIPEYITVNELSPEYSRNLHWHMGQIHAFNDEVEAAISEMEQAYAGGPIYWKCYVDGSIAFLKRDKPKMEKAIETLREQENQMNLDVLERLFQYYDLSYLEAYMGGR